MYSMMEATSKGHMFVHVIDNDRELDPSELDSEDLKVYMNNNVGGAGGFTRGMIEALELPKKPTHVLLMDDDVMVMPESLFRTYYLLRLLKDEYKKCFLSEPCSITTYARSSMRTWDLSTRQTDHTVRSSQLWI